MMNILTVLLTLIGAFFYIAGSVGLLRFPNIFSRLHALTKADNLGLGFIVLGLLFQVENLFVGFQLILIWILMMYTGAASCNALARFAQKQKQ